MGRAPRPDRPTSGPAAETAAAFAHDAGFDVAIAIEDTWTGQVWGGGPNTDMFATESVVKVFIAVRLLVTGQMEGDTESTAYEMITQSDDDAADALYDLAGGDDVIPWAAQHYGITNLGYGPTEPGWWSNSHISAVGLVEFYAAIKADPAVWGWLSNAMANATQYAADGTDQYFGLPSATSDWAIKQGWGADGDDWDASADFNSTGFVLGSRYAVAILLTGPPQSYGSGSPDMLSTIAQMLLPDGQMAH
jgi:hypothetical protein